MSAHFKSFCFGVVIGAAGMWIIYVALLATPARVSDNDDQAAKSDPVPAVVPANPNQSFDWRVVESEDYHKYIANLRAIGCPEATIRDIIIADVNALFEDRRKSSLAAKTNRFEYWKTGDQRFKQVFDEEKVIAQQALAKEKRALLKELLGTDLEEKFDVAPWNPLDEMLDFLALPRRIEVMEIEQRFTAKRMKLLGAGIVAGLDHLLKDVDNERDAEVAKLLSPNELEDYQLRRSETSNKVAWELTGFEPSEQEFRDIFKIRKHIEDEYGRMVNNRLSSAATSKMDEELKSLLGDSRYAEYERSQDDTYQAMYHEARRNGLDKEAANKIYDLRKVAEAQARVVYRDASLTREQRDTALSVIRKAADSAAHAVFSHEAIISLEGGGFWLGNLAPATPVSQ